MSRGPRHGVALLRPGTAQSRWLRGVAPGDLTWHWQPLSASRDVLEQTQLPAGHMPSHFSLLINHNTAENIQM